MSGCTGSTSVNPAFTERKRITVLGSTGSIGISTLDVIARHPERYQVYALTAQRSVDKMLEQARQHQPTVIVMRDEPAATELHQRLASAGLGSIEVRSGAAALAAVAASEDTDYVMAAIVGAAGLLPTLAAVEAGKRILLANKEALVMAGSLFMQAVSTSGAELLPIDSEHNAIFQCLPPQCPEALASAGVRRILLTASGGPFRSWPVEQLQAVTPAQACAHPNWEMGQKISVDSATMMNKGLEFIEACWLFNATPAQVQVVVHPQSVIHSMVEYVDGSVLAQMGNPDMRTPIAHGLAWPQRIDAGVSALDLIATARLDFEAPDEQRFPCLRLAREVMAAGGDAAVVLNAANEVAVERFLAYELNFTAIPAVIESTLEQLQPGSLKTVSDIVEIDQEARNIAQSLCR